MNIDGIPFLNNYFWDSSVQCVNGQLPPPANCDALNNCTGNGNCQLNCTMDQLLSNQNGTANFICVSECFCNIGFGGIDCSMRISNPIILLIFILFPFIIAIIVLVVLCVDYVNRRDQRRRVLARNKIQ